MNVSLELDTMTALSLASNCFLWALAVPLLKNYPTAQKAFSPTNHDDQRDICQTDDLTPQTAIKVNYDSFYYEFLIFGCFMFVKLTWNSEKRFQNV